MQSITHCFLLLLWVVLIPQSMAQSGSNESLSDEETLKHIKLELWPKAYRHGDVALLDRVLHDTFEMIDADGNRSNKQKELDFVKNNDWDPGEFEFRIERLEIYDDKFAVVDGTGEATGYRYKSSNFFIKENNEWKAIASHVSGYQEK